MKSSSAVSVLGVAVTLAVQVFAGRPTVLGETVPSRAITGIAAERTIRVQAPDAPAGKTWLYQVALPFQISATQAALFCNVREALAQGVDFEVGNDVIVFGALDEIADAVPVVANRNHVEPNPRSVPPGEPATMVRYPIRGGFVPLSAKRDDGTPHPHAGTGFGLSMVQAWKALVPGPPPYLQNSYADAEAFGYWELQQYSFDGTTFRVTKTERLAWDELLAGWHFSNGGMTNAIPDGDDLLVAMVGKSRTSEGIAAGETAARFSGSGVLRMRRDGGMWQAVSCLPILPLERTSEPSLVRDVDGRLLATARGGTALNRRNDIRIVQSADQGRTWTLLLEALDGISPAPVTLNQAVDGTPYIAANLRYVMPGANDPLTLAAVARGVAVEPGKDSRSSLNVWPLSSDRQSLASPICVIDCRAEFGPPVNGSNWNWRADHATGKTVRLADGQWHHVLGYRVQDYREIKQAMPPTPQTGMYLQEVLSIGQPHAAWNF